MPLFNIVKSVIGDNPRAGVIFSFLVLTIQLFLIVNFNTSVFFIGERTYLPAIIFVLFSALLHSLQVFNPVLPAILFLMLALKRIMESYRKPGSAFNFFDAAILISIGSLFYANLIWFGLLVFIGIALLRNGNIIEILTSVLGLTVPYILIFGIYYVIGKDPILLMADINENLFHVCPDISLSRMEIVVLVFSCLMILVSLIFLLQRIHSMKIKSRKTFYLLLWEFIISLVLYFVLPSASVELLWIISIPVSYLLTYYFIYNKEKIIPEIFFTGLFLMIIVLQALHLT